MIGKYLQPKTRQPGDHPSPIEDRAESRNVGAHVGDGVDDPEGHAAHKNPCSLARPCSSEDSRVGFYGVKTRVFAVRQDSLYGISGWR